MPVESVAGHQAAHGETVATGDGRSRLRRIALIGGVVVIVFMLGMGGLLRLWSQGTPRPFLDADGRPSAGSVSEKIWVEINGVKQGMVVRGKNTANPVLLVVHGGPGMPDYVLTEKYPPELEDLFTVVWWDQRGAGLSSDPHIPAASMTIEQYIADTLSVTDYLRQRFHQDKIYLLGHSWGSFIGIQAAARSPQRYHAYLGTGQMVFQLESEKMAYDYMLTAYRKLGDTAMVRDLEAAPVSMTTGTPQAYLKVRDKAMHQLGIGTTHDMKSVITGIFLPSWTFHGYTLPEKVGLWRGRSFSQGFGLWEQFIQVDLRKVVPRLEIPVYFLEGKYDYTCNTDLARAYFRALHAPRKGFYEFDDSAHSPVLEQPSQVHRVLQMDVLTGNNTLASLR
jgi:pimeloyl-ACP methyl ester carboxylesterase